MGIFDRFRKKKVTEVMLPDETEVSVQDDTGRREVPEENDIGCRETIEKDDTDCTETTDQDDSGWREETWQDDSSGWGEDESLSLSISKDSVLEETTMPEPAGSDSAFSTASISNEMISRGDMILDTYEVVSDAISGGMGSVWKVHHNGWDQDLAMKRPQPKFFAEGSEQRKKNFIHECEAWIGLGLHPNIVSCYYIREIGGVPSIFSEWMDNGSLKNRIYDGTLYEGTAQEVQARLLDIAIQFARGLRYAHEQNLIHQDVKPDNLLLTGDMEAKVSDFGLARARTMLSHSGDSSGEETFDPGATAVSPSGGKTPAYCSPEQAGELPLTRRTDIYSWAVSVLEMYLGGRPWSSGGKLSGPLVASSCREYLAMCKERPVPAPLQDLLVRCLKQNPEERPSDFGIVEEQLKDIYRETTGSIYPRREPKTAFATADSLNNKALSFIDLGMYEEAGQLLQKTVETDGSLFLYHYNYALYQWNMHRFSDAAFMNYLKKNADKSSLYKTVMEKAARMRGFWDSGKEEYSYPSDKERPENLEPLLPVSKVSADGRYEVEGYIEKERYEPEKYGYRITDRHTGQVKEFPNDYEDYGVSTSRSGGFMHPHFYKSDNVFFAGPRSELVVMAADVLWFFETRTGRLILSLPPVTDEEGDTWEYEVRGYTQSGVIEYRNQEQRWKRWSVDAIRPDPEVSFPYELAGIETVDARLEAERSMERYYMEASSCWDQGNIEGTYRALSKSLEDQVLTRHEPSLQLWSALGEYYERERLVTVVPVTDEPTPVPARNTYMENQQFSMSEEYKNQCDNGQTLLTLDYEEEDEYDTCNDMYEYTFYYTLTAVDKLSGKLYYEVINLEVAGEADWKRFSKDRYLGLTGDYLLWYGREYGETETIDLAELSRKRNGKVRFSLPGGYYLKNTEEGVDIGGFIFDDEFTDFRPLWTSDVIACRDHNYRLVYRYLPRQTEPQEGKEE